MVNVMRHKDLWHPWHILIEVVHVLDLHGIEECVRLREVRGTTETIGWRQHRRLFWSTERRPTANARGPRERIRVLVARLPVGRGCPGKRRRSTGTGERWRIGARDTARVGRRGTGSVTAVLRHCTGTGRRRALAVYPCTVGAHRIGRRSPGARQDSWLGGAPRYAAVRRGSAVYVGTMPGRRIDCVRKPYRGLLRIPKVRGAHVGRWGRDRVLIRRP